MYDEVHVANSDWCKQVKVKKLSSLLLTADSTWTARSTRHRMTALWCSETVDCMLVDAMW